jgi:hypothetical protein
MPVKLPVFFLARPATAALLSYLMPEHADVEGSATLRVRMRRAAAEKRQCRKVQSNHEQ